MRPRNMAMKLTDHFVLILLTVYVQCGNGVDEIWIKTLSSGNVHALNTQHVFNYYNSLSNYHLFPSQNKNFRFSIKACRDAFILLSSAKDLQSQDFYEICMGGSGNSEVYLRRKYNTGNTLLLSTPDILSCTEKRTMEVRWTLDGNMFLYKVTAAGTETILNWTDPNPLPIHGLGIMTGWGANGIWIIEHTSFFIGRYCGSPATYGSMKIRSASTQSSRISCMSKCSPVSACLGVNFNQQTRECELVSGGQLINKLSLPDWSFHTKCLNGTAMCLACLI
ncbi:unnamed protein product [Mytilus coruscus]|uniref:Uncharacterized protein n=1 Tax=Mytilus coruscus TaxID=42192 RepID=A0A6J8DN68_MYTCO|nr:unnamed protein product [Mytilus coruscus]